MDVFQIEAMFQKLNLMMQQRLGTYFSTRNAEIYHMMQARLPHEPKTGYPPNKNLQFHFRFYNTFIIIKSHTLFDDNSVPKFLELLMETYVLDFRGEATKKESNMMSLEYPRSVDPQENQQLYDRFTNMLTQKLYLLCTDLNVYYSQAQYHIDPQNLPVHFETYNLNVIASGHRHLNPSPQPAIAPHPPPQIPFGNGQNPFAHHAPRGGAGGTSGGGSGGAGGTSGGGSGGGDPMSLNTAQLWHTMDRLAILTDKMIVKKHYYST
jgi:hypothetical protein